MDNEEYIKYLIEKDQYSKIYINEYIKKRRGVKIECECGKFTNDIELKRHLKTNYHKKRVDNITDSYTLERFMDIEV